MLQKHFQEKVHEEFLPTKKKDILGHIILDSSQHRLQQASLEEITVKHGNETYLQVLQGFPSHFEIYLRLQY